MLVFKHPKYYEEMRRRAKREQALERKRASERASRREGGPASNEPASEQAALNVVPIIDGEGRCFAVIG